MDKGLKASVFESLFLQRLPLQNLRCGSDSLHVLHGPTHVGTES